MSKFILTKTNTMKTYLKFVLFFVLGLIALVVILALFAPRSFEARSEILINKPQQEVYEYIKYLKNQENYGTWHQMNPDMKKSYTGTDGEEGFVYAWESDKIGSGKQKIVKLLEGEKMETELYFENFKDPAKSIIQLYPKSREQTLVVWEVKGKSPFILNIMNLFVSMDDDFREGLENLKRELEN